LTSQLPKGTFKPFYKSKTDRNINYINFLSGD
jgi:hypothetical protein